VAIYLQAIYTVDHPNGDQERGFGGASMIEELKYSQRTPNFTQLKKAGKLPTNKFWFRKNLLSNIMGGFVFYPSSDPSSWTRFSGPVAAYPWTSMVDNDIEGVSDELRATIFNELSAKMLPNILDSKVNLAQAFGERKQTVSLIVSSINRLSKAFAHLKSGRLLSCFDVLSAGAPSLKEMRTFAQRGRSMNFFDRASVTWLEITYGWKPLVSDIYGAFEAIVDAYIRPPQRKVKVSWKTDAEWQSTFRAGLSDAIFVKDSHTLDVKARMSCEFAIRNELLLSGAQLGLTNPALLAWELMPYSFVVDWALPIGNYLQSLNATDGLEFVNGTWSFKYVRTRSTTASGRRSNGFNGDWTYEGSANGAQVKLEVFRDRLSAFPGNPLPAFKNPFSYPHVFSALSLLQTTFKR